MAYDEMNGADNNDAVPPSYLEIDIVQLDKLDAEISNLFARRTKLVEMIEQKRSAIDERYSYIQQEHSSRLSDNSKTEVAERPLESY